MLSFDFGESHDIYRASLQRFVREKLLPAMAKRTDETAFSWEDYRALGELGILGLGLPAKYGGSGEQDFIALGIAAEELGRASVGLASTAARVGVMGGIIASEASAEVRERYMRGFITGEHMISLGITETESGSDAAALATTARKVDGGWRIDGAKTSISHLADSIALIIFARAPGTEKHHGISAFLVELDRPGVSTRIFNDMGLRDFHRGEVRFEDVFIPDSHLLGVEGKGFSLVMGKFDFARATVALLCLGAAQASLDETALYLRERTTFGKPLSTRQGLTIPFAEHLTQIEAARWLAYRTLWLRQNDLPHTTEAAMAKWWGVDLSRDAIEAALLAHGHGGWCDELPYERRFRDVTGFKIGDGAPEIHKLVIARDKIGREVME